MATDVAFLGLGISSSLIVSALLSSCHFWNKLRIPVLWLLSHSHMIWLLSHSYMLWLLSHSHVPGCCPIPMCSGCCPIPMCSGSCPIPMCRGGVINSMEEPQHTITWATTDSDSCVDWSMVPNTCTYATTNYRNQVTVSLHLARVEQRSN